MASPFPANATLTFLVPTGIPGINDQGEPTSEVEEWVVAAYLKSAKNQNIKNQNTNSGEVARTYLTGRIVSVAVAGTEQDVAALPATVLTGAKAAISLKDPGDQLPEISGDFYLEVAIASAFGTSAALGAPIEGYMVQAVAWGEALL